jgi:GntR family transcriptional regulator, transcriptional repressor for pyruvate dehydrogenase complex
VCHVNETSTRGVFEPVEAPSTYERTVSRLGVAVRIGILPPGSRLPPERVLAEQLCISRSTLRQALASLTETGHLVAVRGRTGGTFVADAPPVASGLPVLSSRAVLDWRMTLELGIVGLAAERATDEQRAALRDEAGACADADGWPEFRRLDARFHLCLAEAAHSQRAIEEMTLVQGELSDLLTHLDRPEVPRKATARQHRDIATAVSDGDAFAAREAMRSHLAFTERHFAGAGNGRPR